MRTFHVTHELTVHVTHRVRASNEQDAAGFATSRALDKAAAIERRHAARVKSVQAVEVVGAFAEYANL